MTIEQIKEILEGNFESAEDRRYWENKLKQAELKEARAKNNEEYFDTMAVYDR